MPYLMIKVLNMLINDIVRFEQLGPGIMAPVVHCFWSRHVMNDKWNISLFLPLRYKEFRVLLIKYHFHLTLYWQYDHR